MQSNQPDLHEIATDPGLGPALVPGVSPLGPEIQPDEFEQSSELLVVAHVKASSSWARRLNLAVDSQIKPGVLVNAEPLRFQVLGDEVIAYARLNGDRWDSASYLNALAAVSSKTKSLQMTVEVGARRLLLREGKFGSDEGRVQKFIQKMRRESRPQVTGRFSRLAIAVGGGRQKAFADALCSHNQVHHTTQTVAGETQLSIALKGDARELDALAHLLYSTWMQVCYASGRGPTVHLHLEGRQTKHIALSNALEWGNFCQELRVAA